MHVHGVMLYACTIYMLICALFQLRICVFVCSGHALIEFHMYTSHLQTELKAFKAKKRHPENALIAELQVGLHTTYYSIVH